MHIVWIIFLAAMGACVGSFLNVVIWRLPRGESIIFPASHCPVCGRGIRWYDNVPIFSWLILRGQCRFCKVAISPRYLLVEAVTSAVVVGLYLCYYVWGLRDGMGTFAETWPIFTAHAILLCGLLACSIIDIEIWQVPLEICWFVSLAGVLIAAIRPSPQLLPQIAPPTGAMCLGAAVGLIIAIILLRRGVIPISFIDADIRQTPRDDKDQSPAASGPAEPKSVAVTSQSGVNPRKEVLKELAFLAPAILAGLGAYLLVTKVGAVHRVWEQFYNLGGGRVGLHVNGLLSSLFGYFIGGLWIWGMRIVGTLGFGKEAMGLGDVHILAAAGAVCGWIIPSAAFFLAPVFGLLWALFLFARRGQRELPYGPWLGAGVLAAMIFHDKIVEYFGDYQGAMKLFSDR